MKKYLSICFLFIVAFSNAQNKVKDTTVRRAKINYFQKDNSVRFAPETPPLIPIAGAPKPSYSYFWEMGDGHYSREAEPKHVYKTKGEYNARVAVTNNYDNGKPPATRPKKVAVNDISSDLYKDIASIETENGLQIQKNCDPVPDQEMVVVLSYQNLENYVANGKLYLFYNEKQFKNKNFELLEYRAHNNEREIKQNIVASVSDLDDSNTYLANQDFAIANKKYLKTTSEEDLDATLLEANKNYLNSTVFEFDNLESKETKNLFFSFKTTPEMIKDTSAIVTMRSVFVPNRSFKNHKVKNLEMQIVTSHDPNKMGSNGQLLNYRLVRFKAVKFKTQFQNNGEGPARMIRLETDIPDMFDKKTFKIVDMYPKCPICPKGEAPTESCLDTIIKQKQIHFTFKNIYLPGTNQKNVKEKDSTKGFVQYSMKFGKDFNKTKTRSRTLIFFDKNEPIITNFATTRFMPGISIGARTGYNLYNKQNNAKSYFLGATISPFKSYKFYWQSEFLINKFENAEDLKASDLAFKNDPISLGNGVIIDQYYKQTTTESRTISNILEVIPVSLRYNINRFIGLGVGTQFSSAVTNIVEKSSLEQFYGLVISPNGVRSPGKEFDMLKKTIPEETKSKAFETVQTSFFVDITAGFARIGPSLGARYILNTTTADLSYVQFYGIWKF